MTAVVGRARHSLSWRRDFDYGVDGMVRELEPRGNRIRETGHGFDFQTKSSTDWHMEGQEVVYDLEAYAYNDLVERAQIASYPFLLILLCLPQNDTDWLAINGSQLVMQRCAFWCQIKGSLTPNTSTKRIKIPETNIFSPVAVAKILADIRNGVMLP